MSKNWRTLAICCVRNYTPVEIHGLYVNHLKIKIVRFPKYNSHDLVYLQHGVVLHSVS